MAWHALQVGTTSSVVTSNPVSVSQPVTVLGGGHVGSALSVGVACAIARALAG